MPKIRVLHGVITAGAVAGALLASAPSAVADPPNCTAADMAGVAAGVSAATSAYLFTHPEVNAFVTGLKGQPRDQVLGQMQQYLDANPQTKAEIRNIRQPLADLRNRCGVNTDMPMAERLNGDQALAPVRARAPSGGAATQPALDHQFTFGLAETTPDAIGLAHLERVCAALGDHRALPAQLLGPPSRAGRGRGRARRRDGRTPTSRRPGRRRASANPTDRHSVRVAAAAVAFEILSLRAYFALMSRWTVIKRSRR